MMTKRAKPYYPWIVKVRVGGRRLAHMDCKWMPKPLARLLSSCRDDLSKARWGNFLTVVMGILVTQGFSHLSSIAEATRRKKGHRTNLGRFLASKCLDSLGLLKRLFTAVLAHILRLIGEIKDRWIYIAIDSTIRERVSLKVVGSQKVKLSNGAFGAGQILMVAVLRVGPFTLPFWVEPVLNKHWAKVLKRPHRTQIQIAEDIIRQFQAPFGWNVAVLFDSFFGANKVLNVCEDRGFVFVTNLKANRKVRAHRPLRQVGGYAANVLGHSHEGIKVGNQTFLVAMRDSSIPGFGRVRLVFSRKPGHKRIFHLATNALTSTAKEIIGLYMKRWSIECLFKDVKHYLGLGDYPARTLEGATNHMRLVFIAHLLLTFLRSLRMEKGKIEMKNASSPAEIRADLRTRFHAYHIKRTLRRKKMPANIDEIICLLNSTG